MATFEQYTIASWKVGTLAKITFSVGDISESGGNRLSRKERAYRDGAKIDDTGAMPRTWSFDATFNNSFQEPGLEENPQVSYPNTLRALLLTFDVHETGDLVLPTIGKVRARLETYTRTERVDERDEGKLALTFVEDNEDALDRAQLRPPSVVATIITLSEQTTFSAEAQGSWSDALADLTASAEELQSLMLAPGRAANDIRTVAVNNRRNVRRIIQTNRTLAEQVGGQSSQPRGSSLERQLRRSSDRQAAAVDERSSGRPRSKAFTVDVAITSIFDIAARFKQDATELLDLNDSLIADPFRLQRGETIRVFETTPS